MPKNWPPDCDCVARSFVEMSKARDGECLLDRDVDAPDPASSIRTCAIEVAAGVGDGNVHGLSDRRAFFSAAAMTFLASSRVIMLSPSVRARAVLLESLSSMEASESTKSRLTHFSELRANTAPEESIICSVAHFPRDALRGFPRRHAVASGTLDAKPRPQSSDGALWIVLICYRGIRCHRSIFIDCLP